MFFKFLSKDYPIEKSFFLISRLCLSWMGEFPQTNSSTLRILSFGFHCVVLLTGVICQFCYGFYYINKDLPSGLDALCPAIFCMVSLIKMILFNIYGKKFNVVLNHFRNLIFSDNDDEKKNIVSEFSTTATKLSFMVFVAGILATVFYGLRPVISNIIRIKMGMEYLFDDMPLRVMLPSVTLTLPWYPLTYAFVIYVGAVTGLAFTGVGGFFVSCCLSSAALFKVLQNDIATTLDQFKNTTKLSKKNSEICCHQLGNIIDRHNEIIGLFKEYTSLFKWIILTHFVTSSVVIGASIIESLLFPGYRAIICTTYTLASMSELYIYCHSATAVFENSTETGIQAYCSTWHSFDPRIQKMILLIIIRSQKPLTMSVPFFEPNLETFTNIVKTAGSVITLVKTIIF